MYNPLAAFAGLPAPAVASATGARRGSGEGGGDQLLTLAPTRYVEALLGRPVGRDGKIACPFHEDELPSLHVYPKPDQGWYCFSCLSGGSVYDLAADLRGYRTSGREFLQLRAGLRSELLDAHDQRDLVAASLVRCPDPDHRAPVEAK